MGIVWGQICICILDHKYYSVQDPIFDTAFERIDTVFRRSCVIYIYIYIYLFIFGERTSLFHVFRTGSMPKLWWEAQYTDTKDVT